MSGISAEEKKESLEATYEIAMTKEMDEEVDEMCNYSDYVEERGIEKGQSKLIKKMHEKGRTLVSIAEETDLPVEEVERLLNLENVK